MELKLIPYASQYFLQKGFLKMRGKGSIRKRPGDIYEGRIMINGERKSVYGSTKCEVEAKLKNLKHEMLTVNIKPLRASDSLTVGQWMDTWLNVWLLNVTVNTKRRYEMEIRLHIKPKLGNVSLPDVTADQIQRLYNEAYQSGLSAKSVKCMHSVLHEAFKKAVEMRLMAENVAERCKVPKQTTYEMRPFRGDDLPHFLDAIAGHRYEDVFYTALFTGMREAELMGLTWDCIDFKRGTIKVYRQLQRTNVNGEYTFTRPKNSKSRLIKPAEDVMHRLSSMKPDGATSNQDAFVFTGGNGQHMTINMLYKPFKKIVSEMGLQDMRFHDLRHTYAVLSLQSGCDIKTLSANLGHASVAFTLDRYGHVSEEMQIKSSQGMQQVISQLNLSCKRNTTVNKRP